jgi:flagellar hook assembly protein FlgD
LDVVVSRLELSTPAPNPFSTTTQFSFSLPARQTARVTVYDIAGRRVRTVLSGEVQDGEHTATWNARDHHGHRVAPGTYFVRLQAGGETMTRKVVFLGD